MLTPLAFIQIELADWFGLLALAPIDIDCAP